MSRSVGLVVAVVMIAMLLPMVVAAATTEGPGTLYLTDDGFPKSSMTPAPPQAGDLSNFDPGRDLASGLILERTALGLQETDGTKHQQWQSDSRGYVLSAVPNLFLWVATEGFDSSKTGVITAYLLECAVWGEDCIAISARHHSFQTGRGDSWLEAKISFDLVEYEIPEGRVLAVRVVAAEESEANLLLAYDRLEFRSRLVFASRSLVPVDELVPQELQAVAAGESSDRGTDEVLSPASLLSHEAEAPAVPTGLRWLAVLGLSSLVLVVLGLVLLATLGSGGQHRRSSGVHAWLDRIESRLNHRSELGSRGR